MIYLLPFRVHVVQKPGSQPNIIAAVNFSFILLSLQANYGCLISLNLYLSAPVNNICCV